MSVRALVAVVLTLNEEEHLGECLRSLAALDAPVIVLDSGSTDGTLAVAREHGAETWTRPFEGYASQRNAALEMAADAEWVAFVDADERMTAAGAAELRAAVARAGPEVSAFALPRRNVCFGRVLRGGGWWPDEQPRVLRRGRARYDPAREVHEVVVADGEIRSLREPLLHLNYVTWREFRTKQREYTLLRVARADAGDVPRRRAYVGRPARELWRRFVRLRGYRDGVTGFLMALTLAIEEARACRLLRRRAAGS